MPFVRFVPAARSDSRYSMHDTGRVTVTAPPFSDGDAIESIAERHGDGDSIEQTTASDRPAVDSSTTSGLNAFKTVSTDHLEITPEDPICTIAVLIDPTGLVSGRRIAARDTTFTTDKPSFEIYAEN